MHAQLEFWWSKKERSKRVCMFSTLRFATLSNFSAQLSQVAMQIAIMYNNRQRHHQQKSKPGGKKEELSVQ